MDRKIPILMASQHPDNISSPYWKKDPFVTTYEETEECYRCYHDLGCDEYMWDWEGKLVDEAVIDRLLRKYNEYFSKHQIGRDLFLTMRIPNQAYESGYRNARAFMGMLSAEEFVRDLKLNTPPLFELILPMTTNAEELMQIETTFQRTAQLKSEVFEQKLGMDRVDVIPLFEGVDNLVNSHAIIQKYFALYRKHFGHNPEYLRPFVARSDPALNSGIVATTLGIKIALSQFAQLAESTGIPMYPIIGPGGLPFRGHLHPQNVKHFVREYAGVYTAVIQSSFRYDWPMDEVKAALKYLKRELPKRQAVTIPPQDRQGLLKIIAIFENHYRKTVEKLADQINDIAAYVPSRRERMLHIGLFGYSRKVGKKALPRAIKFTSALYSIGIPPELIGVGRGLADIKQAGLMDLLFKYYVNLEHDIKNAGYYLNRENLQFLVNDSATWKEVQKDVTLIEEILGLELGPRALEHYIHRNSTSNVYFLKQDGRDFVKEIEWAAKWRKSLG